MRSLIRIFRDTIFLTTMIFGAGIVTGQSSLQPGQTLEWKEFTPEDGRFIVLFPGKPKEYSNNTYNNSGTVEEHVFTLNPDDLELSVAYFEYLRSVTDAGAIGRVLDNARKQALAQTQGKVIKDNPITLDNKYQGRELIMDSPRGLLLRRFYWSTDTLYQLVVVQNNRTSNDQITAKFLSSFSFPGQAKSSNDKAFILPDDGSCTDPSRTSASRVVISEAVLRRNKLSRIQPSYPDKAKQQRMMGKVKIEIVIDENGKVLSAIGKEGPQELQQAAAAALKSTFIPMLQCGKPVVVQSLLTYKFFIQ